MNMIYRSTKNILLKEYQKVFIIQILVTTFCVFVGIHSTIRCAIYMQKTLRMTYKEKGPDLTPHLELPLLQMLKSIGTISFINLSVCRLAL